MLYFSGQRGIIVKSFCYHTGNNKFLKKCLPSMVGSCSSFTIALDFFLYERCRVSLFHSSVPYLNMLNSPLWEGVFVVEKGGGVQHFFIPYSYFPTPYFQVFLSLSNLCMPCMLVLFLFKFFLVWMNKTF